MKAILTKPASTKTSDKRQVRAKDAQFPKMTTAPVSSASYTFIQPKLLCPCGGGCPRCAPAIQPKLKVGAPDDVYEQEADKFADQVMRMPQSAVQKQPEEGEEEEEMLQTKPVEISSLVQRQTEDGEEEEEEEELIQPKPAGLLAPSASPGLESNINSMKGRGQPLPDSTRSFFEPRFGYDFSRVRVHTDSEASETAQALNARAFTIGQDVVFGTGQYSPGTAEGRNLLAHELTHVVQQRNTAWLQRQGYPPHARAYAGEQGLAFNVYRWEEGWAVIRGPSGSAGHHTTASGEDGLYYNVRTRELHIADNKSFARRGRVSSATAIDPSRNLLQNLDDMIRHVESKSPRELPMRQRALKLLRQTRAAIRHGHAIPGRVKLVVGNAGGQSTGVTARLRRLGVKFIDVNQPVVQRPGSKRASIGPPQPLPKKPQPTAPSSTSQQQKPAYTRSPSIGARIRGRYRLRLPSLRFPRLMKIKGFRPRGGARGLVGALLMLILGHYISKKEEEWENKLISRDIERLTPKIQEKLDILKPDIEMYLYETHPSTKLYAHITITIVYSSVWMPEEQSPITTYARTDLTDVRWSAYELAEQKRGLPHTSRQLFHEWQYYPVTFSIPLETVRK